MFFGGEGDVKNKGQEELDVKIIGGHSCKKFKEKEGKKGLKTPQNKGFCCIWCFFCPFWGFVLEGFSS